MMVTSKNKSGMFRSKLQFVFILLIIKEKPLIQSGLWVGSNLLIRFDSKDVDRLLLSSEKNRTQRFYSNITRQTFRSILINQDRTIYSFRMSLDTCRNINSVSDTGIRRAMLCACKTSNY